jgi:hypothetical protein
MLPKLTLAIVFMSLNMVFASQKTASTGHSATPSEMKIQIDSIFINLQNDLDEIASSPAVKNKNLASVNGYFFKELKKNQVYYSFTKVNSKGILTNEVIRLVENNTVKPVSLNKEYWVKRTLTARKPYYGLKKLEQTGRYYLLWAAPILSQDKTGKEVVLGAIALKIDLWDCFHKFANKTEIPFLVRMNKMRLYSNKWENGVKFREELIDIEGIKRITVRYPKDIETTAAPVAPEPVIENTTPAVDSSAIKAAQLDSIKAVKAVQEKKKAQRTNMIIIAVLVLLALIIAFLFIVVPSMKQRRILKEIEKSEDKW